MNGHSKLRRQWLRWRFHLSALLVLIPLGFMPQYFHEAKLDRGLRGLGEREIGNLQVGPWTARMAEWEVGDPEDEGRAGFVKAFTLAFCDSCSAQVKAAYLRIGEPRSLRAAGGLLTGTRHQLFAEVAIPARVTPSDQLWLTVEGWDGAVHQAQVPLDKASPTLVAWLEKTRSTP
ncbi:thiamine pyrophosphate-binding protein [Pseudomonas sp.]|uniref:thiamine pyrophosphate-binding protein n=1 Tax=Pseudomonas sp. TaxID=306 RepID=UPI002915B793|nr:thiamine pyrophosphate-binding protein [Pseudomonas sp.]MDU4249290.1 thiamine pyrophosphate-binding protein [Pseudomonas sp.]